MEGLFSLGKQAYSAYNESQQSNVHKTGGEEYNSPHHSGQGHSSQGGRPEIDHDEAVRTAQNHGSGDSSLFSSALGFISDNKKAHEEPVDEDEVQEAHQRAYHGSGAGGLSASSLGSAAALQALKQFTSGGGGGGSQTQLISLAMAEATKLFDKSGAASGSKQDAVNGAAMTVMKLMVQSKLGGGFTGGGNSGGLGSLLSLASKFT